MVLCLGNRIRHDDAVGFHVAEALGAQVLDGAVVRHSEQSGLYLLDELESFERVVVVDAVRTGQRPAGTVLSFPLEALHTPAGPSPHALGLPSVLELARKLGAEVPARVHLVAIEVKDVDVAEGLSPEVAAAVPGAVEAVVKALAGLATQSQERPA